MRANEPWCAYHGKEDITTRQARRSKLERTHRVLKILECESTPATHTGNEDWDRRTCDDVLYGADIPVVGPRRDLVRHLLFQMSPCQRPPPPAMSIPCRGGIQIAEASMVEWRTMTTAGRSGRDGSTYPFLWSPWGVSAMGDERGRRRWQKKFGREIGSRGGWGR